MSNKKEIFKYIVLLWLGTCVLVCLVGWLVIPNCDLEIKIVVPVTVATFTTALQVLIKYEEEEK